MGFYVQDDFWEAACELSATQRDRFIAGIVTYWFTGGEPALSGASKALFISVKGRIDIAKDRSRAGSKSRTNANQTEIKPAIKTESNGPSNAKQNGGKPIKEEELEEEKRDTPLAGGIEKRPARPAFRPPTAEEVESFKEEKGLSFDTGRFLDYYAAQGWRLSNGNKMRDWCAAARNWARNEVESGANPIQNRSRSGSNPSQNRAESAPDPGNLWLDGYMPEVVYSRE